MPFFQYFSRTAYTQIYKDIENIQARRQSAIRCPRNNPTHPLPVNKLSPTRVHAKIELVRIKDFLRRFFCIFYMRNLRKIENSRTDLGHLIIFQDFSRTFTQILGLLGHFAFFQDFSRTVYTLTREDVIIKVVSIKF